MGSFTKVGRHFMVIRQWISIIQTEKKFLATFAGSTVRHLNFKSFCPCHITILSCQTLDVNPLMSFCITMSFLCVLCPMWLVITKSSLCLVILFVIISWFICLVCEVVVISGHMSLSFMIHCPSNVHQVLFCLEIFFLPFMTKIL